LIVAAAGAAVLGLALFLPWYGADGLRAVAPAAPTAARPVSRPHATGAATATVAATASSSGTGNRVPAEPERLVLLALAGLALVDALAPLWQEDGHVPEGGGASLALLGGATTALVLYRLLEPPATGLWLREGGWLALAGCVAIVLGAAWPRQTATAGAGQGEAAGGTPTPALS
jgi:hypothetical protein